MALNPAAYIDGGKVFGETLRRALYVSTGGATGVATAADFAVRALATPGAAVWVGPGGGVIATRFSDADPAQSYSVSASTATQVAVPANTGPATAYWRVIVRVSDPQYAGEPIPSDPENATYSTIEVVSTLPTGKPYLWLATIAMPAGATTVQPSYIIDRRELVNPRRLRDLKALAITTTDPLDSTDFEQWPDQALWSIDVPTWATQVKIVVTWYNVATMPGSNVSELTFRMGHGRSDVKVINSTHAVVVSATDQRRQTVGAADTIAVPAGWRGATITCMGWARKKSGNISVIADAWASVALDIEFMEVPE